MPAIVFDYGQQLATANDHLHISIAAMGVMAILLIIAVIALVVSIRRLHDRSRMIEDAHEELKAAHLMTEQTNQRLCDATASLSEQTHLRESCISLFMELTAAYINKLNSFQLNVQRKIKAHQTEDLLKHINPARMSEQDAREFFNNFDQTFLSAFPHFVDNINALLRPDCRFMLTDMRTLNLDLRILALMRLGVKDSIKIATLLNCSQQTIYNHRSTLKSYALCRDTFDADIAKT